MKMKKTLKEVFFLNEIEDIHEKDIQILYSKMEDLIQVKRTMFEKHKVMTDMLDQIQTESEGKSQNQNNEDCESDNFCEEETTTQEELENFEKWAKDQAKKSLMKHKEWTNIMQIEDIRELIMKLNDQQRKFLDDFCERLIHDDGSKFYLYLAGEAGTGKSFLLRIMIEVLKYLKLTPGDDLRKPPAIIIAPTANAACIINGKTIESALGMLPRNTSTFSKRKSDRASHLTFLYESVAVVFCDEISMVGSSKFTRMNFQLQYIKGNANFMVGLSFVAV